MPVTATQRSLAVGTLNVRSLSFKLGAVLELANSQDLSLLCLQETRIGSDSVNAVRTTAKSAGYQLFLGSQTCDAGGSPYAGVSFLSRWPATAVVVPDDVHQPGRVAALRLHRHQARPLLFISVYLQASDACEAASLLDKVFAWAASLGEEWCIAGDFNLLKSHWPTSYALASGSLYDADAVAGDPSNLPGTRRNEQGKLTGRVIDYMLHCPALHVLQREQHRGVADHDLVTYSVQMCAQEACYSWPRRPAVVRTATPSEDEWAAAWEVHGPAFEQGLRDNDVDSAWAALSAAFVTLLGRSGSTAAPHDSRAPVQSLPTPQPRAPTFQSISERRLRRLFRRAGELVRNGPQPDLLRNLRRDVRDLAPDFPALLHQDWGTAEAAQNVLQIANEVASQDAAYRVQTWKARVTEDTSRLARWIKGQTPDDPPHDAATLPWTAPVHPQLQAQQERDRWHALWCPPDADRPDMDSFARLRRFVPPSVPFSLPQLTAEMLSHQAKKAAKRAPGLDGWAASSLSLLGDAAFQKLAALWRAILRIGVVPAAWKHVKITLIAKPDRSWRPLAIASIAYRLGMACLIKACRPWFDTWADPELLGGVAGRSIHDLHADLFEDMRVARSSRAPFLGVKQDVKKCFDSVWVQLALDAWTWLGAPQELTQVIHNFYLGQRRWLTVRGHVAPQPVSPDRGLLQGCPASVGLLNGLMLLWARRLRHFHPQLKQFIYLDDRTAWTCGHAAVANMCDALETAAETDRALGFSVHPDKRACWALRPQERREAAQSPEVLGPVVDRFKLLGIYDRICRATGQVEGSRIGELIRSRARRIGMAARGLAVRRVLLQS